MRQRFCKVCRGWHELHKWPAECWVEKTSSRSDLAFPMIGVNDTTEPLVSMADGKTYTSKAKMRESYKASNNPQGVNFIEVGHETRAKPQTKPKPDRAAIKDSVDRAYSEMRTRGEIA